MRIFIVSGYEVRLQIREFRGRNDNLLNEYALTTFSNSLTNVSLRLSRENVSKFICYIGKDLNYFVSYKEANLLLEGIISFVLNIYNMKDFLTQKKREVMVKIAQLTKIKKIDANAILQNIYNGRLNGTDDWTLLEDIKPEYYDHLNELEDRNLIISRESRYYYKIKSNFVVSLCCNPSVC